MSISGSRIGGMRFRSSPRPRLGFVCLAIAAVGMKIGTRRMMLLVGSAADVFCLRSALLPFGSRPFDVGVTMQV
jgi:hypothetical protein